MDAALDHNAIPALDLDAWGAVYNTRESGYWVDLWVKVVDHDGVAYDGSSHIVEATLWDATNQQLNFDSIQGSTVAYYGYGYSPEQPLAPGDYTITFTVTDPDGNTGTVDDVMTVLPLDPPDKTKFVPSNQYPVLQNVTASFDNVFVNGSLYEDFNVGSIGELDQGKWDYIDFDDVYIQDQELKITRGDCSGNCDSALHFIDPATINSIQADIGIDNVSSHAPMAGIEGVYYNNGTNDVYANIMVSKNELDDDHAVRYHVFELIFSGGLVSLNTLAEGELMTFDPGTTPTVTASIAWDGADFIFDADGNQAGYTAAGDILPVEDSFGRGKRLVIDLPVTAADTSPTFTWDPVPNANHYRVRIFNSTLSSTIWRGYYGAGTSYTMPPGILQPNSQYFYRIEARDAHSSMDTDNNSRAPDDDGDFAFWTGDESPDPFIDLDSTGVQTWNNSYTGPYLSFWIKVHDPQGVPENIQTVMVTLPDSTEVMLYPDMGSGTTSTSGYYSTSFFPPPTEDGTYTFTVIDKDDNVGTRSEDLTFDPIGFPDETSMSPAPFTVINETAVEFDWGDVSDAAFYRVEIYDIDYNRIYKFDTTESQYSLPAGFLKNGTLYRYRIVTRGEFFSQNVDNNSRSPWDYWGQFTFITTPLTGGVATPQMDLGDAGVSVRHFQKPDTGASAYMLQFDVDVTDMDGVPENIQSVRVTYPDFTTIDLRLDNLISSTEGSYWNLEMYDNLLDIQEGVYTIRVTDFDDNYDELTDDLVVNELPIPTNVTPGQDSTVSNTTPLIDWDDVSGAARYKVKIYDGNSTRHASNYLTASDYTVPGGILEAGHIYDYRIYAYRETAPGEDIDNYSIDQWWSSDRYHFTTSVPVGELPVAVDDDFVMDEGALTNLDLTNNDTDGDGDIDEASIVIRSDPTYGSIIVNANGTVDYTHDGSETLDDSFTYTIKDLADNTSNIALVNLTINIQNDAPEVDDIPDQTIDEGDTFVTINLDDYVSDEEDLDADITWTYIGETDLAVDITDRVATIIIPNTDWFGVETITFTATDSGTLFAEDDVIFEVLNVNDGPVVTNIPDQTIAEGETFLTINLDDYVSDVDNVDAEMTWTYSGTTELTVSIDVNRVATILSRMLTGTVRKRSRSAPPIPAHCMLRMRLHLQ